MDSMIIGLFLLGTCLGSFLNVVILRYCEAITQNKKSFYIHGRSFCPTCRRQLRWWELVPLLSFIFLRGRCHRCHQEISIQYPLVELTMGLGVLALAARLPVAPGEIIMVILEIIIAALLVVLFVVDLKTMLLPDIFVGALLVCVIALHLVSYNLSPITYNLRDAVWGVAIGAGFLLFPWIITRGRGIGLGDIKLMVPLGLWAGLTGTITLLFAAYVAGGTVAFYLLGRKKANLKTAMPFGPFLCGAALLLLLWPALPEQLITLLFGYNPFR